MTLDVSKLDIPDRFRIERTSEEKSSLIVEEEQTRPTRYTLTNDKAEEIRRVLKLSGADSRSQIVAFNSIRQILEG
jgi:hypothetical protein